LNEERKEYFGICVFQLMGFGQFVFVSATAPFLSCVGFVASRLLSKLVGLSSG